MNGRAKRLAFLLGLVLCTPTTLFAYSEEELIKFIDTGQFQKVIDHFPVEPNGSEPLLVLKAHALLGLAGFDPFTLIPAIRAPQHLSDKLMTDYFEHCPNDQIGKRYSGTPKCLVLRFFNQIPEHTPPMIEARNTLALLYSQGRLVRPDGRPGCGQDCVLFSILELSIVFSKLRQALYQFNAPDENDVTYENVVDMFSTISSAAKDLEAFLTHYKDVEVLFQHKVFGAKMDLLFQTTAEGKVEFLQETGLPLFFRVTDFSKEGTIEIAGRIIIIQALDRLDNFFRSELQEFPTL